MGIKKYLTLGTIVMSCNILIPANPRPLLDSRHTQAIHVTPEVSEAQGEEIDISPWKSDLQEIEYKMFGNISFSNEMHYEVLRRIKELRCTLAYLGNNVCLENLNWWSTRSSTELTATSQEGWYSAILIQAYGIAVILRDDTLFLIPMSACKELDQLVKQIERDLGISTPQGALDTSGEVAQEEKWERVD